MAEQDDNRRLNDLGYKPALRRDLSGVGSFCFSICLYAIPLSLTSRYTLGFYYGGPVIIMWGWLLVSFFSTFVVLSIAEILSSFPIAGGIYQQSFNLGGERWGPLASWWTGWLSWVGLVSSITNVNYLLGQNIGIIVSLATGSSYTLSNRAIFAISLSALVIEMLINAFPMRVLERVTILGAMWTVFVTIFLIVLIPSIAPEHQNFSYAFTTFYDNSGASGLNSPVYLSLVGLLMSQFCLIGFDLNGYFSEETKKSGSSSPRATIYSFVSTVGMGFALLLAITLSIQDPNNVLNPDSQTGGGLAAFQIYFDVFYARYSTGLGALVILGFISVCSIFGNIARLAGGSRLMWAMSRDGAIPFSSIWVYLTPKGGIPLSSLLLTTITSLAFSLPLCWDVLVFNALNSVAFISSFLSISIPIYLKLTYGKKGFQPGPFSLKWFSPLVNIISLLWIWSMSLLFCLPRMFPATWQNLNYEPLTFAALFVAVTLPWVLPNYFFGFKGGPGHYKDGKLSGYYSRLDDQMPASPKRNETREVNNDERVL